MRIMVTNDDGIHSPGIVALASAIWRAGHEVVVIAPDTEWSGAGTAISSFQTKGRIHVHPASFDSMPGVVGHAVAGSPALTVVLAANGALGEPPDLIVSGINAGANVGRAVAHSGTVGACFAGQGWGRSGLAVSLQGDPSKIDDSWNWATAGQFAVELIDMVAAAPRPTVLSLNVPNRPYHDVLGLRWASLAPVGALRLAFDEHPEGGFQSHLLEHTRDLRTNSDESLLRDGYATVTALIAACEVWGPPTSATIEPGAPVDFAAPVPSTGDPGALVRPASYDATEYPLTAGGAGGALPT